MKVKSFQEKLSDLLVSYWFFFVLLIIFVFVPLFFVKSASLLLAIMILYYKAVNKIFIVKKFWVMMLLLLAFFLEFIFTPYWIIPGNMLINTLYFIVLSVIGALWGYYASGDINIANKLKTVNASYLNNSKRHSKHLSNYPSNLLSYYLWFLLLFVSLFFIQYPALHSDISSVGDESAHVTGAKIIALFLNDFCKIGIDMAVRTFSSNPLMVSLITALLVLAILAAFWIWWHARNYREKNAQKGIYNKFRQVILILFGLAVLASYAITYIYKNFFYIYIC